MVNLLEESVTETIKKCPKCGGKLVVRVSKEKQQKMKGSWFIKRCDDCDYYACGFL